MPAGSVNRGAKRYREAVLSRLMVFSLDPEDPPLKFAAGKTLLWRGQRLLSQARALSWSLGLSFYRLEALHFRTR